ncbi:hypothetical protein [Pseudomonas sp.]
MPAITPMPFIHDSRRAERQPWPLLCRPGLPLRQQTPRRPLGR